MLTIPNSLEAMKAEFYQHAGIHGLLWHSNTTRVILQTQLIPSPRTHARISTSTALELVHTEPLCVSDLLRFPSVVRLSRDCGWHSNYEIGVTESIHC